MSTYYLSCFLGVVDNGNSTFGSHFPSAGLERHPFLRTLFRLRAKNIFLVVLGTSATALTSTTGSDWGVSTAHMYNKIYWPMKTY